MAYINIKFITDQTGANSNVCSGTNIVFNFSLTDTYNALYADIALKKGSGTTASITASIYDGKNGTGNSVGSVTVLAANVSASSYDPTIFSFTNVVLSPNVSYSLVLSSTTSCVGNNPYSMKSGNFQVLNADTGTLLNIGYGISASLTSVNTFSADATIIPPTPTPTPTQTPTPTSSRTPTPTQTSSVTPSITSSITPTPTPTNTITPSITLSITPSTTPTNTITPSITLSITPTISQTPPIQTPSNTTNTPKGPHVGAAHVKFRLGSKIPKIYRGSSVIYNPNN